MKQPLFIKPLAFAAAVLIAASSLCAQTDLYHRYAEQSGVKVASVSGFAIDSVSHIDVTLVEATDDEGWQWMKQEFAIGELAGGQEANLSSGNDVVLFARRNRANPSEDAPVSGDRIDASASCYIGISYLNRTVYIFCADNEEQSDAIVTLLVRKIMHSSK